MYAKKEGNTVPAELMVIAVSDLNRSQGIGRQLLQRVEKKFKKRGIDQYKVTVHKEMDQSIHFYQENGFKFQNTFRLYDYDWNVYQKGIQIN